jgi:transposase
LDHSGTPGRVLPGEIEPAVRAIADAPGPVRKPLPPHLPRQTVLHEPACTCPGCGGGRR